MLLGGGAVSAQAGCYGDLVTGQTELDLGVSTWANCERYQNQAACADLDPYWIHIGPLAVASFRLTEVVKVRKFHDPGS